jgi:hypothetical protein
MCRLQDVSVSENLSKAFVSPSAVWLNSGSLNGPIQIAARKGWFGSNIWTENS